MTTASKQWRTFSRTNHNLARSNQTRYPFTDIGNSSVGTCGKMSRTTTVCLALTVVGGMGDDEVGGMGDDEVGGMGDESGIVSLARNCKNLTKILLFRCTYVGDTDVVALAEHCPNLTELDLERTNVTDKGVRALADGCPKLSVINLQDTKVTSNV